MCELTVLLDGKEVFKDAIYAKAENGKVEIKDVLGGSKVIEKCDIKEVNISSERLILVTSRTKFSSQDAL